MIVVTLALVALAIVCSTAETRERGRELVKPYGRAASVLAAIIWGLIILW